MNINQSSENELEQEVNLLSYLLIVLRYWWIVGPATIAGAVGAYFIAQNLPPKYQATCRFEIIQNKISQLSEDVDDSIRVKSPIDRHIVLLKSEKLNNQVSKSTLETHSDIEDIKLKQFSVNASPVRGAEKSMIDISVVSFKKEAAYDYLNLLLKNYAQMRIEENKLTSQATKEALEKESQAIISEIEKQNEMIVDFKTKNNYVFLSTKTEFDKQYVAELFANANQKQFELDVLQPKVDKLAKEGKDDNKNFAEVIDALMSNPNSSTSGFLMTDISEWKMRQIQMGSLKAEYDILMKKFKAAHPTMQDLNKRMEILQTELTAYRKNILDTIISRIATIKSEKQSYINRAVEIEKSFGNNGNLLNAIENMEGKLEQLTELKNSIRAKLIALNENVDDKYITRIIREPFASSDPVFPNIPKMTAMGAIIFNLISAGIIIFLFMGKTKRYNFSKIIKDYELPVLSVIPRYPSNIAKKNPFFLNELPKNSVLAESFRTLRLNVEQKSQGSLVVFTSFGPGEGKTSTSLNTALCCSWTDKKILIVDADFRRCTLRNSFPDKPHAGLLDYLKNTDTDICQFIQSNVSGNLDYLPAGNSDEFVTELIDGKRMEDLLIQLRKDYDLVIFDTAPAVRIVDTVHLAEKTDATLIIARLGKTYPHDIESTIKRLPKNKLIGFVMNDFKQSDVKFASHNKEATQSYSYGYSYQSYNSKY